MRIPRLLAILTAAALLPVSVGVGAGAAAPVATSSNDIVIGVESPQTGTQASNGMDMLRGAQLAVRQVNAAGGVLGRHVRIVALDDQADPSLGASLVDQAAKAGAVAVIGPYNSGVGKVNLPLYVKKKIVPLRMTSATETEGYGATTQPMDSQISPVEVAYITSVGAKRVAMLVDIDPSGYTVGMADRTQAALEAKGVAVTRVPVTPGLSDYSADIATALASSPDLIYSSTYYPEGSKIAREIDSMDTDVKCFMVLANVDPAFVTEAGIPASQRCVFVGTPTASQLPMARSYVREYRKAFGKAPGVWGTFTYDSANVLFAAMRKAGTTDHQPLSKAVKATKDFTGASGAITFERPSGNRKVVPVFVLEVNDRGTFVIGD